MTRAIALLAGPGAAVAVAAGMFGRVGVPVRTPAPTAVVRAN